MKNLRTSKVKRFTLIELMLAIAVIAILASLLLPTLAKARERARMVQCANNQKQIALALYMYTSDHKSYYPASFGEYNWDDQLVSYLSLDWTDADKQQPAITNPDLQKDIFLCPRDDIAPQSSSKFRKSYAVNEYQPDKPAAPGLMGYENSDTGKVAASVAVYKVTQPTRTLLLGELWSRFNYAGGGQNHSFVRGYTYKNLKFNPSSNAAERALCHDGDGLANFAYVDGSVGSKNGALLLEGAANNGQTNDMTGSWLDSGK